MSHCTQCKNPTTGKPVTHRPGTVCPLAGGNQKPQGTDSGAPSPVRPTAPTGPKMPVITGVDKSTRKAYEFMLQHGKIDKNYGQFYTWKNLLRWDEECKHLMECGISGNKSTEFISDSWTVYADSYAEPTEHHGVRCTLRCNCAPKELASYNDQWDGIGPRYASLNVVIEGKDFSLAAFIRGDSEYLFRNNDWW